MVLLLALTLLAQAQPDRVRALQLYRAKQYVAACPLFERVTRAAPKDPEAWNDYALCLIRARSLPLEPALPAIVTAWSLARPDSRERSAALFNLGVYFLLSSAGTARFEDPACPGSAVEISRHLGALAVRVDGGVATELDLGIVEAWLPPPRCLPEWVEGDACEDLAEKTDASRAIAARARKKEQDVCAALRAAFPRQFEQLTRAHSVACGVAANESMKAMEKEMTRAPRCQLLEIDVCGGRGRARCDGVDEAFTQRP